MPLELYPNLVQKSGSCLLVHLILALADLTENSVEKYLKSWFVCGNLIPSWCVRSHPNPQHCSCVFKNEKK